MTKKRWIVLDGMLTACVCLTLAVLALLPARPRVTPANIVRIEDGMTLEEVETILGGPGECLHGPTLSVKWDHPYNESWVAVGFDDANRVKAIYWEPPPRPRETFMQKVRRLLRL
jgi:hypothetical protein